MGGTKSCLKKIWLGVVRPSYNPNTWEAKARELGFEVSWSTKWDSRRKKIGGGVDGWGQKERKKDKNKMRNKEKRPSLWNLLSAILKSLGCLATLTALNVEYSLSRSAIISILALPHPCFSTPHDSMQELENILAQYALQDAKASIGYKVGLFVATVFSFNNHSPTSLNFDIKNIQYFKVKGTVFSPLG